MREELQLARWSQELLSYQLGSRSQAIKKSLAGTAAQVGLLPWQGAQAPTAERSNFLKRRQANLFSWFDYVLSRVTNAPCTHILEPALRRANGLRPHPLAVALCVKALKGVRANVVYELVAQEPARRLPDSAHWQVAWESLPRYAHIEREELLVSLIRSEAPPEGGKTALDHHLASQLGISREAIKWWRARSPRIVAALGFWRPDLYR